MKSKKNPILKEVAKNLEKEAILTYVEDAIVAVGGKRKTRKLKKLSKKQQNVRSLRKRTTKRRQIHKKR